MVVSVLNCPRFWTARGCVDGVSLYGPLRSEAEFRHHLPVLLRTQSPFRDVYLEDSGEVLPKFCLG